MKISQVYKENFNIADITHPKTIRMLGRVMRNAHAQERNFLIALLQSLVEERDVRDALLHLGIEPKDFLKQSKDLWARIPEGEKLFLDVQSLMVSAYAAAVHAEEEYIEPRNVFVALYEMQVPAIRKIFELFSIQKTELISASVFGRYQSLMKRVHSLPLILGGFGHQSRFLRHRVMNRAWTARPTPILDSYSSDLTDLAREERIGFLIGHIHEYDELIHALSRPGKPNAILVGDPGSGKSTIIAHLAYNMVKDKVPEALFDKRLVSLDVSALLAESKQDIILERIEKMVREILTAGNVILFIPNMHDLFKVSKDGSISGMDILLPIIKSEQVPIIGESFPQEFKKFIESRGDFMDLFEVIRVQEISEEEAIEFLSYESLLLERQFKVRVSFQSIRTAVSLAHQYFRNRPLPGSASDLLKEALSRARQHKVYMLKESDVVALAETKSRIPIRPAKGIEAEKLLKLEEIIHKKLINQEVAVKSVSRALREYRSGLSRKGGPIASFLFVGPTGVGKTELSKILSEVQFGSKNAMERFDMSEYQDKQSIFRFIGTPDGTKSGTLTDAISLRPYSLILLDEFEKAHPDILNLFLQVLDDGRLTDNLGKTIDFQNTIIIATSNAHSAYIKSEIESGKKTSEIGEALKKRLTEYFKPELLNRFSDVVVFRDLTKDEVRNVAKLFVAEVQGTLRETHGIELSVSEDALSRIAELGYSPAFGARPLRQVISERIRGALAEKILKQEIRRGMMLRLVYVQDDFSFIHE